jgi:Glycosyltransferase family 29 (sialyltransferase)
MEQYLFAVGDASDPFGFLANLRRSHPESFADFAEQLLRSSSTNPGIWRYLALHFIRTQRYDLAAIASDRHLFLSPRSHEALQRHYRIALLAANSRNALQILKEYRDQLSEFQYECNRFLYLLRFNDGLIAVEREIARLRERTCFELTRALLREMGKDTPEANQSSDQKPSGAQTRPLLLLENDRRFAQVMTKLDGVRRVTILGNGGSLRGSGMGKYIDSQEFVIRINFPRIGSFAEDVGVRTDLVFFTEAYLHTEDNILALQQLRSAYAGVPAIAIDAARNKFAEKVALFDDLDEEISLVPVEIRSVLRSLSYDFATTGLCCLVLLFLRLREVQVFGFDFYSPKTATHFFSAKSAEVFIGHETAFEEFLVTSVFGRIANESG